MPAFSLPANRPIGRALVVGTTAYRAASVKLLEQLGYEAMEVEDPYTAMAELCHRPLVYRTLVLSLGSLFREELAIIASVKRRFSHVEIWLAHTDGRAAALAEACRLGADGLLSEEGLHRLATGVPKAEAESAHEQPPAEAPAKSVADAEPAAPALPGDAPRQVERSDVPEPILTAEELRALLQEIPSPPAHDRDV